MTETGQTATPPAPASAIPAQVTAGLRGLLYIGAGVLVARGYISASQETYGVGFAMTVATFAWGQWAERAKHKTWQSALAAAVQSAIALATASGAAAPAPVVQPPAPGPQATMQPIPDKPGT